MGYAAVKEELNTRSFSLSPEQFENLCKILIQEVEAPHSIELTPFGGDGGIDIRGQDGTSFFDHSFGVQVKQNSPDNTVGKPKMRNFVGALNQHEYQYGCFITSSEFVSDIDRVTDGQPIVLIDRERLFDIMIANGVGVQQKNSSYKIDHGFWDLFETPEDDDRISSILIPQADSLEVMHITLEAIYEGKRFKPQITDYMIAHTKRDSWDKRQADYYPNAALALGFVHKDTKAEYKGRQMQRWGLTKSGREYMEHVRANRMGTARKFLTNNLREVEIIKRIVKEIEEKGSISNDELSDIIAQETELTGATVGRRRTTVANWLSELPEVNQVTVGNTYRYDYIEKSLKDY